MVLWVLLVSGTAFGGAPPSKADAELEQRMRADVAAVSAEAATAWDAANTARDARNADDAIAGYRKVIALAPGLDHPHRRLCGVLAVSDIDAAIPECETALSLAPTSGYDKSALAAVLLKRGKPADRPRAIGLARAAAEALPDDVSVAEMDCSARALAMNVDDVSACVDHLLALAPDDVMGNYFASGVAAYRQDTAWASIYLERAKDNGLPPALYDEMRKKLDRARPHESSSMSTDEVLAIGVPIVGGWILLMLALLVAGNLLSARALRTADHEPGIRRAYRVVLLLVGLLFYVSLPLVIAVVVFGALATIAIFDDMGATPLFVIGLAIALVASTIAAVSRSLLAKRPLKIEGDPLDPASHPQLKQVLDEVAAAVGTRPVDLVYLTPGTDLAITEQPSLWRALRGARTERILILGVGLFHDMKQRELRAMLAHEYGRFRDDVGGHALSVRGSLNALIEGISRSRVPSLVNPAWWFVRAFRHIYLVVSTGASRVQAAIADRLAIRAYGSEAFVAGARHVVARQLELPQDVAQTIKDVIENKWSLPNLYAYDPEQKKSPDERKAAIAKALDREPQRFDSHPSWRQRLQVAAQLALPGEAACTDGDAPVWNLFPDPERIERNMTAIIRTRIQTKMGVTVSDAEWDDEEPAA